MKKSKHRILIIVLVVLIGVFVLTKLFRTPALQSNFDTGLFAIDTSLIRSVSLHRPGKPALTLERDDSIWTVSENGKSASAGTAAIDNLTRSLARVKPQRIVSRKEDKWATYQVDDSTAIHLTARDQDDVPLIDWYIGKESPQGVTYIRPADEDEVYAMEGGLRSDTDNEFNEWRDKTFLRVKPDAINKITFTFPSDSGFVLQKSGESWMIGEQAADSTQVARYLNKFRMRNLSTFADGTAPTRTPDVTITVDTSGDVPTVVKGWKDDQDQWTLNSTVQPDAYFVDSRLDDDLFVGKRSFLPTK